MGQLAQGEPLEWYPVREPETGVQVALDRRKTDQAHLCLAMPAVSATDPRRYALRMMNAVSPMRWWLYGSPPALDIVLDAFNRFNVGITVDLEPGASGEMGRMARDVPSMQVITSPEIKHTDQDIPEWFHAVPVIDTGCRRLRQDDEHEIVLFAKRHDMQITQPLPAVDPDAVESRAVLALKIFEDVSAGLSVKEDARVGLRDDRGSEHQGVLARGALAQTGGLQGLHLGGQAEGARGRDLLLKNLRREIQLKGPVLDTRLVEGGDVLQRQAILLGGERHHGRIPVAHVDRLIQLEDLGLLALFDHAGLVDQIDHG